MQFRRTFNSMKEMQETNRTTVLRELFANSPLSRGEIAEKTGLSSPTISRIVKDLIREKLVVEVGKVEVPWGRNRDLLQIDYDRIHILGFEVNETFIHGILCNFKGDIKASLSQEVVSKQPQDLGRQIQSIVTRFNTGNEFRKIIGIGLSISGIVSPYQGEVIRSNTMGWQSVRMDSLLSPMETQMLLVENDANAALLGELWFGEPSGRQNVVYIIIGGGVIGASLVVDGKLVRGSGLIAGEISHFPVEKNGKKCPCGNSGCLETYVSLERLQADYTKLSGRTGRLLDAYKAGDTLAGQLVEEAARKIAVLILSIAYLINPEEVILGGLWIEAGEQFLQIIRSQVEKEFSLGKEYLPRIVYSALHPRAGVLGAAGLVINEFFRYQ